MNDILSEKEYQHFIMDRLSQDNGYVIRKATNYDRFFAVLDRFRHFNSTIKNFHILKACSSQ